jgi:hypothetical protein
MEEAMKRILLLAGVAMLFAAGTASAQTSVQLSFGFGEPRPYISGDVFIGGSFIRPVYRPYYYYYPNRYPYYFYEPLPRWYGPSRRVIIYERDHRFYRRDFDRDQDWQRQFGRQRDWDRAHGRERNRDFDQERRHRGHDDER